MPSTFFYFVPDKNALTLADAAALGLAYAFEGGIDCHQVQRGPDGKQGIVVAQQDAYTDGQLGYFSDRQVWRSIPGTPLLVGYHKDSPPTPEDLARSTQLDGEQLRFDDGQSWRVPVARHYSEKADAEDVRIYYSVQLPQRLDLSADGRWVAGGVTPRYAELWALCESWVRIRDGQASDEDRRRFDYRGQIDGAVLCLQSNYRLGRSEAALLGLLNDELAVRVLDTLSDVRTFEALVKKKLSRLTSQSTSASSAGPAAEIPITDRPPPT